MGLETMDSNSSLVITCTLLGALGGLNIFILSLLLSQIRGLREDLKGVYKALNQKLDKDDFCRQIYHHSHNERGQVTIPASEI